MQLAMIGLGKMGGGMVRRLMKGGHDCVVFDLNRANVDSLVSDGAKGASTMKEMVSKMSAPRAVWLMVPAGEPTEKAVKELGEILSPGDTIIDGGNSYFKDDVRRAGMLREKKLHYVDVGTSGGVWGLERGFSLMIGGVTEAVDRLLPIFETLAPGVGSIPLTKGRAGKETAERGFLHCGPVGAGHFVKMIHNGIEYGLMQAFAEGFDILTNANSELLPPEHRYNFEVAEIAEVWRRGSVVASWLLDLAANALTEDDTLSKFSGVVEDSGEGRWTIIAAIEEAVPADALAAALNARFRSRREHLFGEKLLSAMRFQFGGHVEHGAPKDEK